MKICGSLLLVLCAGVAPAFAQTFHVNSARDEVDPLPGDGLCWTGSLLEAPPNPQECTLRAALMEANHPTPGRRPTYRIYLPAGTYSIELTADAEVEEYRQLAGMMSTDVASENNDFDLRSDVWITGAGVGLTIIDGARHDRIFDIVGTDGSANAVFEQMTLRGGMTRGPGGCVRNLAAGGLVYLNNVVIEGCVSEEGRGGGMINHGSVIMTRVQFIGNEAYFGGGLENLLNANIYESTFHRNTGQLSIDRPTRGGAISNLAGASLTLSNSTLSRNSAVLGGGLFNQGRASILNSTISTNGGRGGGIANVGPGAEGGRLEVVSSTITNNNGLGIFTIFFPGPVELRGTIVAGNRDAPRAPANCEGGITSSRESLEDLNTCGLVGAGDIFNTDPLLGPLADNGGPTQTHALLAGSPAIDAAPSRYERRDQRDYPRPMFGASDIGAYEKGVEFLAVIPFEWTYLYRDVFTRADTTFRLSLSLRTAGIGSEIGDARIIGAKGANGPVKIELAKDGQSYEVSGTFTPPKDQSNSTLFYLEVLPAPDKASQLRIGNVACDCDARPRKNPPPIIIPRGDQIEKK